MRDPQRINRIIERLRVAWHANPDMRLGQLIMNAQRWLDHVDAARSVWAAEDDLTESGLEAMVDRSIVLDPVVEMVRLRDEVQTMSAQIENLEEQLEDERRYRLGL